MDAVLVEPRSSRQPTSGALLTDVALACIASGPASMSKSDLLRELAPLFANAKGADEWKVVAERVLADLIAVGFVEIAGNRVRATRAGMGQAFAFLGLNASSIPDWPELKAGPVLAKALGIERFTPAQAKALAKPEGLAGSIVVKAFNLKIKGNLTASRLRAALSVVALERAFGNQIKVGFGGKSGMSPKASRLLAAQLTRRQKDPGTDARLIEVLAAEAVGVKKANLKELQLAVLRKWLGGEPPAKPQRPAAKRAKSNVAAQITLPFEAVAPQPDVVPKAVETPVIREAPVQRPTFESFVAGVRSASVARATGWAGNRKAYISQVWQQVRASQPGWAITEVEFKAMLAEAHRMGRVALSTADLKDPTALEAVQNSALTYRNAVFHFVRVDE